MRILAASLILAASASGAQASSVVTIEVEPNAVWPSVVFFDAPAKAAPASIQFVTTEDRTPSPSVIALGTPAPAIDHEEVAAIPDAKPPRRSGPPMVIRGGLVGEAFAKPVPAVEPAEPAVEQTAAPEDAAAAEAPADAGKLPPDSPVLE